ncbi:MAG: flagellar hook-basal body complex protein FliE [Spirochaetaceae bacterium]|nr:flagellar hook-basal body complex protein FliE [Spirochaetaceae bacterium]
MFGSLELTRTETAHIGTAPISGKNQKVDILIGAEDESKGKFQNYLLDAVKSLNEQQTNVAHIQEQVITDPDSGDIHDVTIAMAKAQMSLSLAQTVIERVVQGWNDISTTR